MKVKTLTYNSSYKDWSRNETMVFIFIGFGFCYIFSQDKSKEKELQLQKSNDFVYEGNELVDEDDYISAEMEYRKAISEQPTNVAGTYNLGNSYYEKGQYDEALFRHLQAAERATSKEKKHKAYHNIGNILMQNKSVKKLLKLLKMH